MSNVICCLLMVDGNRYVELTQEQIVSLSVYLQSKKKVSGIVDEIGIVKLTLSESVVEVVGVMVYGKAIHDYERVIMFGRGEGINE